mgnify:FL=1
MEAPYIAIVSGGVGTRLWPRSRKASPKQLLPLLQGKSLAQATLDRILPLTTPERIFVVTVPEQSEEIKSQLSLIPEGNILVEPEGKNTAMAIGMAVAHISHVEEDATMLSLGADHYVGNDDVFRDALNAAVQAAQGDELVTIGISPESPDTGFGYIQTGNKIGEHKGSEIRRVEAFHEKPSKELAEKYVESGEYLWNSNYFCWRIDTIKKAFSSHRPRMAAHIERIRRAIGTPDYVEVVAVCYEEAEDQAIDIAIMEKATNTLVVCGKFPWADVGTWQGAYRIAIESNSNFRTGSDEAPVIFEQSKGCLVDSSGRLVAIVGLEDVVVVETDDVVLVCAREHAQRVGDVVKSLPQRGLQRLT